MREDKLTKKQFHAVMNGLNSIQNSKQPMRLKNRSIGYMIVLHALKLNGLSESGNGRFRVIQILMVGGLWLLL